MSTTLAITAFLLWLAVFLEAHNPGIVRRLIAIPFMLLVVCTAWVFQLVSGWRIHLDLEAPYGSAEPTRILYEDSQL